MPLLWLDPWAGISGDMFLAALLDAGLPWAGLTADLKRLRLPGLRLSRQRVRRGALRATRIRVQDEARTRSHRTWRDLQRLLHQAALPLPVKRDALRVFERLARVEGRLHGVPAAQVHFHELGAADTLADIVGVCAGLHRLQVTRILTSAVNVGSGVIRTEHGLLPVPAPATLELLRGFTLFSQGPQAEHTTPTGAALLAVLARPAAGLPLLRPLAVGYGAGSRSWPDFPNLLRAVLAEPPGAAPGGGLLEEEVCVLKTAVDDVSPQVLAYAQQRLLAAGALDVTLQPLQMKKGRPGHGLEIVCRQAQARELARLLVLETRTLGLRVTQERRWILERQQSRLKVGDCALRMKTGWLEGAAVARTPEYEDARACAERTGRPLRRILLLAEAKAEAQTRAAGPAAPARRKHLLRKIRREKQGE